MEKNLYIDASHPNETRVVLKSNSNIEDYEYEGLKNNLIKNNIYLGKVSRIEPSLQAAFIDFGREKHGFLLANPMKPDLLDPMLHMIKSAIRCYTYSKKRSSGAQTNLPVERTRSIRSVHLHPLTSRPAWHSTRPSRPVACHRLYRPHLRRRPHRAS